MKAFYRFYDDLLIDVANCFQYLVLKLSNTNEYSCAQQDLASRSLRASQLVGPDVNMLLN